MENTPRTVIGEFIDAVVKEPARAASLLAAHPDLLNARWIHDETVLHFLAVEGFADGVTFLASRGADVNLVNKFGDPPLVDVAVLGYHDIAEILLRHGADPNASSATQDNAVHAAACSGNVLLVRTLLDAGANPRYRTDLDESVFDAIDRAPRNRDALLTLLTERGIVPDETDDGP